VFVRRVPCHRTFIAHYEHVLADPSAYLEPLSDFFELGPSHKEVSVVAETVCCWW
jgi:hypothetical protein